MKKIKQIFKIIIEFITRAEKRKKKAQADVRLAMENAREEAIRMEIEREKKQFNDYLQALIDEGKKQGLDEDQAKKRALRKIDEKIDRARRSGRLIACKVCGRAGCFHDTGGFRKNYDGTYTHQNCRGK